MTKKRLSSADRRDSIIDAATTVFAQNGFAGAKTQEIARTAKVSEALLFRHFPTKTALYRAVLRRMISRQDAVLRVLGGMSTDTAGIIDMLRRIVIHSLKGREAANAEGMRIMFASLAGDGNYARLAYRRALRLWFGPFQQAVDNAREAGDLTGESIAPRNLFAFVEHVSSMMLVARAHSTFAVSYEGEDDQLMHDAILFCARGLGLTEAAINAHRHLINAAGQPARG